MKLVISIDREALSYMEDRGEFPAFTDGDRTLYLIDGPDLHIIKAIAPDTKFLDPKTSFPTFVPAPGVSVKDACFMLRSFFSTFGIKKSVLSEVGGDRIVCLVSGHRPGDIELCLAKLKDYVVPLDDDSWYIDPRLGDQECVTQSEST